MTIGELIQILQQMNPKLPAMTYDRYGSVEEVKEIKELDWDEGTKALIIAN